MPSLINAVPMLDDTPPNRSGASFLNGMAAPPTPADAWEANTKAYGDWANQQQQAEIRTGMRDAVSGELTDAGQRQQMFGAAMGIALGTTAPGFKGPGLIAYHGSPVGDLTALDLAKTGTGAFAGRFAEGNTLEPQAYLATEPSHAASYGENVHKFSIDAPLLEKDAVPELQNWAKELGYSGAQEMIDKYFDGNAYEALRADEYFLDAVREAKTAGLPGAKVSFGDLKDSTTGTNRKIGDVIILHDASVATKVPD
jgi:hypothetical protein